MDPLSDALRFIGFEAGFSGKTVTGAPFTANISTHITHTLAGGNRINVSTSGTIARDSQGRTRRDVTLPAIGPWADAVNTPHAIFISDPVSRTFFIVNTNRKVAHEVQPWNPAGEAGRMRQFGEGREDKKNEVTTDLGTKTINGVSARGTRVTRTIPAGAIGNEKPIKIVTERWFSPDLQMNVLVKRSNPLVGETLFELTNIERREPDASLFKVPSNYTIRQGGPGGPRAATRRHVRRQPPASPSQENAPENPPPAQEPQQ